jgi:hypothetical protein
MPETKRELYLPPVEPGGGAVTYQWRDVPASDSMVPDPAVKVAEGTPSEAIAAEAAADVSLPGDRQEEKKPKRR